MTYHASFIQNLNLMILFLKENAGNHTEPLLGQKNKFPEEAKQIFRWANVAFTTNEVD